MLGEDDTPILSKPSLTIALRSRRSGREQDYYIQHRKLNVNLEFQQRALDVYVAVGYSIIVTASILVLDIGTPLGVLLVLFAPGYLVASALFPRKGELSWTERIALSLALSIAIIPLLILLLNFTPFGIGLRPIASTIGVFTTVAGSLAYLRRTRLPLQERLSAPVEASLRFWDDYDVRDKLLTVALAFAIMLAAGSLAYFALAPRPSEASTEFYILSSTGNASGYPTSLNISQTTTVIVGVA